MTKATIIVEVLEEHDEDRDHPNWKTSCEVCIANAIKKAKKVMYQVDQEKLCKNQVMIDYKIRGARFQMFY